MELQDKVVVITGGASGLGRATADYFVGKGARVSLFDLNEEAGNAAVTELGEGNALFAATDVTSEESVAAAVEATMNKFGAIHVNINCAGVPAPCKVLDREGKATALKKFAFVVNVNLVGLFNVMSRCAEKMALNEPDDSDERGVVINISSGAAFEGQIGQAAYSASKAALVGMTLPIAREFAEYGIRIMTIAPGLFETPMVAGLPDNVRDALIAMLPFPRRMGEPSEFAMLCRQIIENPMLNGRTIRLDGAVTMQAR